MNKNTEKKPQKHTKKYVLRRVSVISMFLSNFFSNFLTRVHMCLQIQFSPFELIKNQKVQFFVFSISYTKKTQETKIVKKINERKTVK